MGLDPQQAGPYLPAPAGTCLCGKELEGDGLYGRVGHRLAKALLSGYGFLGARERQRSKHNSQEKGEEYRADAYWGPWVCQHELTENSHAGLSRCQISLSEEHDWGTAQGQRAMTEQNHTDAHDFSTRPLLGKGNRRRLSSG